VEGGEAASSAEGDETPKPSSDDAPAEKAVKPVTEEAIKKELL